MAFQVSKSTITRERSIILLIHELKSKKTWLEAYRNSYLHFIDPWAAVAVYTDRHTDTQTHRYTDTQTHYRIPRLRMRTPRHNNYTIWKLLLPHSYKEDDSCQETNQRDSTANVWNNLQCQQLSNTHTSVIILWGRILAKCLPAMQPITLSRYWIVAPDFYAGTKFTLACENRSMNWSAY